MQITTNPNNLASHELYMRLMHATRDYLVSKGYLEIDLPVLTPQLIPESYQEVFKTNYTFLNQDKELFLTPSPELFLKRILAYLKINCFSLGKSFRNSEPASDLHSSEFTMLEFYKIHANYMDIADELLGLLACVAQSLNNKDEITYQGKIISFNKWEKISVTEAFEKFAKIGERVLFSKELFMKASQDKGYKTDSFTYEDLFSQIYTQEIEPNLGVNGSPTLIYDYPREFAALAKLNPDGRTAQRFEFYIAGIELGDCYTELTNKKEQEERFISEQQARREAGKQHYPTDQGFLEALEHGLPECAGIAIGFERLAMIFANKTSIHELKLIDIQ